MADQWIDIDYVDARMGLDVRLSLTSEQSVDILAFIETGTSLVQGIARAAGYTTPATTTCELCRGAVYAVMYELLAAQPNNSVTLPTDWANSLVGRLPLTWLESGTAQPALALASTGAAIGGWTASSANATGSDIADKLPKATRTTLAGY